MEGSIMFVDDGDGGAIDMGVWKVCKECYNAGL